MHLFPKIRHKLVLLWITSVILALLLLGLAFAILTTDLYRSTAHRDIHAAFDLLQEELLDQMEGLQSHLARLSGDADFVATVSLISRYQEPANYQPLVFDPEKERLALTLSRHAHTAEMDQIALYAADGEVIAFALDGSGDGYLSYLQGRPSLRLRPPGAEGFAEIKEPPEGMEVRLATMAPAPTLSIRSTGQALLLSATAPLTRRTATSLSEAVGTARAAHFLDQRFIDAIARRTHLAFGISFDQRTWSGLHGVQGTDLPRPEGRPTQGMDARIAPPTLTATESHFVGISALHLSDGGTVTLIVAAERTALTRDLELFRNAFLLILALFAALFLPIGIWLIHRLISRPLERLTAGLDEFRAGRFHPVQRFPWAAEFDQLANSFNHMAIIIRDREQELLKLSRAVDQSPVSVIITDPQGAIEYVNPKFQEVTGYGPDEVLGRDPSLLKSGTVSRGQYQHLWATITAGHEWHGEFCNRRKNGELFWESASISPIKDADGRITHFVAVKEDITLRKSYEEQILRQSHFDPLTDLPNRVLGFDRLSQALLAARHDAEPVTILLVDLDQFKHINETLGHDAGDRVLVECARRLLTAIREQDSIARMGGDEFLVVLPGVGELRDVEFHAERILGCLAPPVPLEGQEVFVTASLGISLYPADGTDPRVLMRNADAALFRSKEEGRNTFSFFTQEMNQRAKHRLRMETQLRRATERGEFSLLYQPIVDVRTGRIAGAEALLRWNNEELGPVPPAAFIPLAEDTGLIVGIGRWVLESACRLIARLGAESGLPLRASVNVSVRQIKAGGLDATVAAILLNTGLPADRLELEITEGLLLDDDEMTRTTLSALSRLGVRLSIDDFGTGFSSISYLKRFPFTLLKIDKSFVHDVTDGNHSAELVRAIIAMGHGLGMEVLAEGVETDEQMAFLVGEGLDLVQGYLFGEPMPEKELSGMTGRRLIP